jgi:hypothetical protein
MLREVRAEVFGVLHVEVHTNALRLELHCELVIPHKAVGGLSGAAEEREAHNQQHWKQLQKAAAAAAAARDAAEEHRRYNQTQISAMQREAHYQKDSTGSSTSSTSTRLVTAKHQQLQSPAKACRGPCCSLIK